MGQKIGDEAVQYFQMSNEGILIAAVNNDIPTDRIKAIMKTTGKVGTGLQIVGVLGNVASAGHTLYKISQDGMSVQYGADLVFNAIAFVPGWGWVVSGAYSTAKANVEITNQLIEISPEDYIKWYSTSNMCYCFVKGDSRCNNKSGRRE